ncbi:MAG TPA: nitrilase-related carbon-nitrogen hydrolase [Solirubrobacterales bacterium]
MRALLAQLDPEPGALAENAAQAAAAIREHPEVDLAVFPELFLSGYRLEDMEAVACEVDGLELGVIATACAAAGTAAIVGFVERDGTKFRNAAACFDSAGEHVATYRKSQLFGAEADAFAPGECLLVVELAGRSVAPLICFDIEFPELARAAAVAGADLLVTVAANMEPFKREHLIHTTARALENRVPHLYVNRVGHESGFDFVGGSRAIDSDGVVLVEADGPGPQLFEAEVGAQGTADDRVDYLAFEPSRPRVTVQAKSWVRGPAGGEGSHLAPQATNHQSA